MTDPITAIASVHRRLVASLGPSYFEGDDLWLDPTDGTLNANGVTYREHPRTGRIWAAFAEGAGVRFGIVNEDQGVIDWDDELEGLPEWN